MTTESSGRHDREPDAAERADLLRAAADGDAGARERLLGGHLSWVLEAVKQRGDRSLDAGDLFQEGTIGLMRAIDDYAGSGREDFESYARERILKQMDAALEREDAAASEASGLVRAAEEYERAEQATRKHKGRQGTDQEVADHLKWTVARTAEVRQIVDAARRHHDEEILPFLDHEDVTPDELRRLLDEHERD